MVKTFDFCHSCKLSYSYLIMLTDDEGVLRTWGKPDKCKICKNCFDCCKCPNIYLHNTILSNDGRKTKHS